MNRGEMRAWIFKITGGLREEEALCSVLSVFFVLCKYIQSREVPLFATASPWLGLLGGALLREG